MIQAQLKLRLNAKQDALLKGWLWNLTGVYNWAIRKIELDARDSIYCLFIDAQPKVIQRTAHGQIGIDPGFKNLLTTSDGEIIPHPRELEAGAIRLAQAQRGRSRKLTARLQERQANRRKDRNHKLSRRLVAENVLIAFSADRHQAVAHKFGKSVTSSSHGQLRQQISYKMPTSGGRYVEVDSKFSTMTCSTCGARTGPQGWVGLSVRQWTCTECGTLHERDVNAARNTLAAALGMLSQERHEKLCSVERVA